MAAITGVLAAVATIGVAANTASSIIAANELNAAADREAAIIRQGVSAAKQYIKDNVDLEKLAKEKQKELIAEGKKTQQGLLSKGKDTQQALIEQGKKAEQDIIAKGKEESTAPLTAYQLAGEEALDMYFKGLNTPGAITSSPAYQFRADQIMKEIGQQAAFAGKGRSDVVLSKYVAPALNDLTLDETNNYFNRLIPAINTGYSASKSISDISGNAAQSYLAVEGNANQNLLSLEGNYTQGMLGTENEANKYSMNIEDIAKSNLAGYNQDLANLEMSATAKEGAIEMSKGKNTAGMYSNIGNAVNQGVQDYAYMSYLNKAPGSTEIYDKNGVKITPYNKYKNPYRREGVA